jgi:DNA primase catalytic core
MARGYTISSALRRVAMRMMPACVIAAMLMRMIGGGGGRGDGSVDAFVVGGGGPQCRPRIYKLYSAPPKEEHDQKTTASVSAAEDVPIATKVSSNGARLKTASNSTKLAGRIDFSHLDDLKRSIDIISVVENYGLDRFQRYGRERASAVCPFHNDHNPSLSIDGRRQMYKCFACGAGGDVFRFVREYNRVQGKSMSFFEAVREVSDGVVDVGSVVPPTDTHLSPDVTERFQQRKDRILLANAAAAAFYNDCLKQPHGGPARSHIQSRSISASVVRAFALGYAPDAYYGEKSVDRRWGEGSLIEHMRGLNFTATDLLDAGLAVMTRRAYDVSSSKRTVPTVNVGDEGDSGSGRSKNNFNTNNNASTSIDDSQINNNNHNGAVGSSGRDDRNDGSDTSVSFDVIMDRFRGRLMVPILDGSGKNVIGFGGRTLNSSTDFDMHNAKYINSPESLVFEKKLVLFGEHFARQCARDSAREQYNLPVLMVEGYMDAISVWKAGYRCVVASMGTSVSLEQLRIAADIAFISSQRVVLCFDNDEAGVMAAQRLCSNDYLLQVSKTKGVEFHIATLPDGVKDPAEYFDVHGISADILQKFKDSVVDKSIAWTDWHLKRTVKGVILDDGDDQSNSLLLAFEQVADFVARSLEEPVRTQTVRTVAELLAAKITKQNNDTEFADVIYDQITIDLLDLVSRIVSSRESATESQKLPKDYSSIIKSLAKGNGLTSASAVDVTKLSTEALAEHREKLDNTEFSLSLRMQDKVEKKQRKVVKVEKPKRRKITTIKRTNARALAAHQPRSLLPHFSGFVFTHKSDEEWLGVSRSVSCVGSCKHLFTTALC